MPSKDRMRTICFGVAPTDCNTPNCRSRSLEETSNAVSMTRRSDSAKKITKMKNIAK